MPNSNVFCCWWFAWIIPGGNCLVTVKSIGSPHNWIITHLLDTNHLLIIIASTKSLCFMVISPFLASFSSSELLVGWQWLRFSWNWAVASKRTAAVDAVVLPGRLGAAGTDAAWWREHGGQGDESLEYTHLIYIYRSVYRSVYIYTDATSICPSHIVM